MLNIDGNNNITLTRGDTLTLTVTLLHEVDRMCLRKVT